MRVCMQKMHACIYPEFAGRHIVADTLRGSEWHARLAGLIARQGRREDNEDEQRACELKGPRQSTTTYPSGEFDRPRDRNL